MSDLVPRGDNIVLLELKDLLSWYFTVRQGLIQEVCYKTRILLHWEIILYHIYMEMFGSNISRMKMKWSVHILIDRYTEF